LHDFTFTIRNIVKKNYRFTISRIFHEFLRLTAMGRVCGTEVGGWGRRNVYSVVVRKQGIQITGKT
jgi:hypothetical protein